MASFEDDVGRIIPQLRRFARALAPGQSVQAADDLVQETVVLALRSDRRRPAAILTWCLATIVRLHRLRHGRASRGCDARGTTPLGLSERPARPASPGAAPSIVASLERLGVEGRETVCLVGVAGLSYAQAADVLGTTPDVVLARLTAARDRLLDAETDAALGGGGERSTASAGRASHLRLVT